LRLHSLFFTSHSQVAEAILLLQCLFSTVPYQLHIDKEHFYHGLLQMALYAAGVTGTSEFSTSHGRIDLVIDLPSRRYICEVKFNTSAEIALAQIEERRYYEPSVLAGKPIFLLGLGLGWQVYETVYETSYN
jgi:hypothetical protein